MTDTLLNLKKACDTVFSLTGLDVELFDSRFEHIALFVHGELPDTIAACFDNYNHETLKQFEHSLESACFLHKITELDIFFLDIRIQVTESEYYYAVVGPVLTEPCTDSLILNTLQKLKLPLSMRNAVKNFFRTIPCYSTHINNALRVSYYLLTNFMDMKQIHILPPLENVNGASAKVHLFSEEYGVSEDELQLNADCEREWRAAISSGDLNRVFTLIDKMSANPKLYQPFFNPFDSLKYTLTEVHALCRAAALDGGAEPVKIYENYKKHIKKIEDAANMLDLEETEKSLFTSYCALVVESRTKGFSPIVKKAIEFLYANYTLPVTLQMTAAKIHCSEGHLSRIFQKETGQTLGQYLNELRIRQAKSMLESSETSITDIALMSGFSSYTRFSIEFKKQTGINASEYRKTVNCQNHA